MRKTAASLIATTLIVLAPALPSAGQAPSPLAADPTPLEQALELNWELKEADGRLNATYNDLAKLIGPTERRKLVEEQLAWLTQRNEKCADLAAQSLSLYALCLLSQTQDRLAELEPPPQQAKAQVLPAAPVAQPLPAAVARMRQDIFYAARARDYAKLDALAKSGNGRLKFTFGTPTVLPSQTWKASAAQGYDALAAMVRILNTTPAIQTEGPVRMYWWPGLHTKTEPANWEWEQLRMALPTTDVAAMRANGSYTGMRIGITASGDWEFAIAGD